MPLERGLVQVYTGKGKGKTSAALGLSVRAAGHGLRVMFIQFMKGRFDYGELSSLRSLPGISLVQFGRDSFVNPESPEPEDIRAARDALEAGLDALSSGDYDLVVLDEINVALGYNLVSLEDVVRLLDSRPPNVELVMTGRYAHPEVIRRADLVTEMLDVKHPFDDGIPARRGIEY